MIRGHLELNGPCFPGATLYADEVVPLESSPTKRCRTWTNVVGMSEEKAGFSAILAHSGVE